MKKAFLAIALTVSSLSLFAQKYKAFKVDIGIGYASPSSGGSGAKGGVTFTIEPHYRLSDALALGLRMEGAALGYTNGTNSDVTISVLSSYCATGEYYLSESGFRPYVGAGAGIFASSSVTAGSGSSAVVVPGDSKFGFFPRLGFETGHFRLGAEYNILSSNSGYLAVKLGFFFGGGKK